MKMHDLRMWQKRDLTMTWWIVAITLLLFVLQFPFLAFALCFFHIAFCIRGVIKRNAIKKGWIRFSEEIGLKQMLLVPLEQTQEIHSFEIHIRPPNGQRSATTVIREYVRDLERLYTYALELPAKEVVFMGTSHDIWTRAAIHQTRKWGLVCEERPELLDPSAPMTKRDWKTAVKKFRNRQNVKCPSKNEWKSYICRIQKL